MLTGRFSSGVSGSAAASDSAPKSGGLSLSSVRSLVLPGTVLLMLMTVPSGEMVMLVLRVCVFFLPE